MADETRPDKGTQNDTITITLSRSEAGRISEGMSDFLCWCRGYMAGRPEPDRYSPFGMEEVRDLQIKLNNALSPHGWGAPF